MDQFPALAGAAILTYIAHAWYKARNPGRPGPPGLPILGNLLDLGPQPHVTLAKWYKQYGDGFFVKMGTVDWFIMSTDKSIREILVRRGSKTATRPYQHVNSGIIGHGNRNIAYLQYGDLWKTHRRVCNSGMTKAIIADNAHSIAREAARLSSHLFRLSQTSEGKGVEVFRLLQSYTLNGVFLSLFGSDRDAFEDPLLQKIIDSNDFIFNFDLGRRAGFDFFPILRRFDFGLGIVRGAAKKRHGYITSIIEDMRVKMEDPTIEVPESLLRNALQAVESGEFTEMDLRGLISACMTAGTETTSVTLSWFIVLMTKFPHVLKRFQAEVDAAVGRDRLPTPEDMAAIPYTKLLLREIFRFRPPGNLNLPRTATEDLVYNGRVIKKGTWLVINVSPINSDPEKYDHPEEFRPERWEHDQRSMTEEAMGSQDDRNIWVLGHGRRICPGMRLAEMELHMALTIMAWAFDITTGEGSTTDIDSVVPGLIGHPAPRGVVFTPRGPEVETLLSQSLQGTSISTYDSRK